MPSARPRWVRSEVALPNPLRWLHAQRVLHARELLERTQLSVDEVAQRSGFGSATSLRTHLGRALGTTPSAYRGAFAGTR